MKKNPPWISQLGEKNLFEKIPSDLFRMWSNHFAAHTHRDTVLFKKSIREQRIRFYGNKELSSIIYGNSRKSREPPNFFSGDETITRLYTRKATDIRMRTSKKNESGILNQNLCGSNEGYDTWKPGDPKGSGFTFANMAYPGASYNVGSMFREKDLGNLFQLIFASGEYFRFKNLHLVADSHFGHFVPLCFSRLWKVYITTSFNASSRIGISNVKELSKEKLSKSERESLCLTLNKEIFLDEKRNDRESSDSDIENYCEQENSKMKKRKFNSLKNRLQFFEKHLSLKDKGSFRVWKAVIRPLPHTSIPIYLHAINDSKPVFRITNKYAALPLVKMKVTKENHEGRKELVELKTTQAHRTFRMKMGFNDASDRMRNLLGLSARYYKAWPKHLVAKTIEDAIINSYNNYLLDPACPIESWPEFLLEVVQEFLDSGANLRKRKVHAYKRSYRRSPKRPRPGGEAILEIGLRCNGGKSITSFKEVPKNKRTRQCAFCKRKKAKYMCRSCKSHLCLTTPMPGDKVYAVNGPCCFVRFHGIHSFPHG